MTRTLRHTLASTALLLAPSFTAIAQQAAQPAPSASDATKPSLVGEALAGYNQTKKIIIAAAKVMPAENFSFKPTPEIHSYAELFTHVAQCTSPRGSVTGVPGRNAAAVILKEFRTSLEEVVKKV